MERSQAETAAELAAEVQRAATMEAKGNSGVILSTIVRGMATRPRGGARRRSGLAEALRAGATTAYDAVKHPVEGTMLTVIREMAEEAERPEVPRCPSPTRCGWSSRVATAQFAGRPSCSTRCARPAWSTRAAWASSSLPEASCTS